VYGFLVRRLGDPALAEDLYQEAFLRLHRARGSYDSTRPFRAWLFSIVHNLLNDALRSRSRLEKVQVTDEPRKTGELDGRAAELGVNANTPENLVATRQSSRALAAALSSLPADEATVLILARLEGLSYDDIGSVIGRSSAAAKQLAYRALKRLRSELVAAGHEDVP
jgi:RNA polymerase sigma-70 factor (ECF subfamily)